MTDLCVTAKNLPFCVNAIKDEVVWILQKTNPIYLLRTGNEMMKNESVNHKPSLCAHTPCDRVGWFARLTFFMLRKKQFLDSETNTSHCVCCGELIRVPDLYTHPLLKVGYSIASCILEYVFLCVFLTDYSAMLFLIGTFCTMLLVAMLVMVTNGLILSFCPWVLQQEEDYYILQDDHSGWKNRGATCIAVIVGFQIAYIIRLTCFVL